MRVNNGRTLISTHRMTPGILGRNAVEKVQFRENHFFIALFSLFLDHCEYYSDFTNRILINFLLFTNIRCHPIECEFPEDTRHGMVEFSGLRVGSMARYVCIYNWKVMHSSEILMLDEIAKTQIDHFVPFSDLYLQTQRPGEKIKIA